MSSIPDEANPITLKFRQHVADIKPLPLPAYRALLEGETKPTLDIIASYVFRVANAHSWYKKLPFLPPGVPFQFYLKLSRNHWPTGASAFGARRSIGIVQGPARYYGDRHSALCYAEVDPRLWRGSLSEEEAPEYAHLPIVAQANCLHRIPYEIHDKGQIMLTSVMHEGAAFPLDVTYHGLVSPEDRKAKEKRFFPPDSPGWPLESGGDKALEKMIAIASALPNGMGYFGTPEIRSILGPERQRLHGLMMQRMEQVIDLIWPSESYRDCEQASSPEAAHIPTIRFVVSAFIAGRNGNIDQAPSLLTYWTSALDEQLKRRPGVWERLTQSFSKHRAETSRVVDMNLGSLSQSNAEVSCTLQTDGNCGMR